MSNKLEEIIMKKLLIALLVLGSFSILAQERTLLTIKNKTYPAYMLKLNCLDSSCSKIEMKQYTMWFGEVIETYTHSISFDKIKERAAAKAERAWECEGDGWDPVYGFSADASFYSITDLVTRDIGDDFSEGYEARAIGKVLLTPIAFALDTLFAPGLAPFVIKDCYEARNPKYSLRHKKALRKLERILRSETVSLKAREYNKVKKQLEEMSRL